MDDVDVANDRAEQEREGLAKLAAAAANNRTKPTGECHYCGDPVEHPKIFCDSACSQDHERARQAEIRAKGVR